MPSKKLKGLVIILSFFLISGAGILLSGRMQNAGFGTGFIAAAVFIFLYTILQQRKTELAGEAKAGTAMMIAGRAAYSALALFVVGTCLVIFGASALQLVMTLDIFRTLGAASGILFLIFLWLFAYYQNHFKE